MECVQCHKNIALEHEIDIEGYEGWCYPCYKELRKPTVCVDLDGVLAEYRGWKGKHHMGYPRPGAQEFLSILELQGYNVAIHSTRNTDDVDRWLKYHDLDGYVYQITNKKIPAVAYIDDRALPFTGDFTATLEALKNFKPYWKEER